MGEFIRLQYQFMKTLTEEQVLSFVPKWITAEEAETILTGANPDNTEQSCMEDL